METVYPLETFQLILLVELVAFLHFAVFCVTKFKDLLLHTACVFLFLLYFISSNPIYPRHSAKSLKFNGRVVSAQEASSIIYPYHKTA